VIVVDKSGGNGALRRLDANRHARFGENETTGTRMRVRNFVIRLVVRG
jgi:hypothetical protein